MGEVYLAEDLKLHRPAALKFLSEQLSGDPELRARFEEREAQAAAGLNHPNIVTVYEIAEHEGRPFIAMEYVDGPTLGEYCSSKELTWDAILHLATHVASALAEAHRAGTVHRDLKPENVLIDHEGHPKVFDFGLAKVKGTSNLTRAESTLGTAAYMSPEQVQVQDVDHRSDLFSFGVMLYQIVSNQLPFRGDHDSAVAYAIVHEESEPLARYKTDTPDELQRIVTKLLAKNPAQRYQSADDLVADLRALRAERSSARGKPVRPRPTPTILLVVAAVIVVAATAGVVFVLYIWKPQTPTDSSDRKMLVVLPFSNLGDASKEYFVDGLTEEVTTRLGGIRDLGVISRTSAMSYKSVQRTTREIAAELGVQFLLEGTVQWYPAPDGRELLKVTSRLIHGSDDRQLWTESFQAELADVFAIQSQIGMAVAKALDVTLFEREEALLAEHPTDNLDAYDFFLQGSSYYNRGVQADDLQHAIRLFQRAIALEPGFALAYARLSLAHSRMHWWRYEPTVDHLRLAHEAVENARKFDPEISEAHLAMGYYYYYGGLDYANALSEFSHALEDQPNNSDLYAAIGFVQRRQGRFDSSLVNLDRALQLDPRSAFKAFELGNTFYRLRRWDEAEGLLDRAIALVPDHPSAFSRKIRLAVYRDADLARAGDILAEARRNIDAVSLNEDMVWLLMLRGDYQEALSGLVVVDGDRATYYYTRFQILRMMGDVDASQAYADSARAMLEGFIADEPNEASLHRYLGIVLAGTGESESAIRSVERALALVPVGKDGFFGGPSNIEAMAQVYAMLGDHERAAAQLEDLLALPAGLVTRQYLRVAPEYSSLRGNASFDTLVAGQ